MTDDSELLLLRLTMIAIIFLFVLGVAFMMRSGVNVRATSSRPAARASVRPVGARLVVLVPARTGLRPGDEFGVAGDMTLGRDPSNGIVLGDASVSGRHASVARTRDGWRVIDLGSTNGTLVDGDHVDGRGAVLHDGSQLSLGSVVLRFHR